MQVITSVSKRVGNGTTRPFFATCEDERLYIAKAQNMYTFNHKAEFNEAIGYRFARLLELPIPNAKIVNLPQEIIDSKDELQEIEVVPGPCFASEYHKGSILSSPILFNCCVNPDDIPSFFLFDQLILNDDRGANDGNLYFDQHTRKAMLIDQSNIFKNALVWTADELLSYQKIPPVTVPIEGRIYKYMKSFVNGNSPFAKISDKLDTITPNDISGLFADIPLEWSIDKKEIAACNSFLLFQVQHYKEILQKIRPDFTSWKGDV